MPITLADCQALDAADELAPFRDLFALPERLIYLDGNSLGARPHAVTARINAVMEQEWGTALIRSWNDAGWMTMPGRLGDKVAQLIGAPAGSVMVGDTTSVNLFKMLAVALAARPDRRVILSERHNFPTDLYMAEGLAAMLGRGHTLKLVEPHEVPAAIDDSVAVVMLTHVNYHTGAMYDMAAITAATHAAGAISLWDLCHSIGAVPVDLTAAGADLAVGCGYKYLNGGPGAPAFLYVAPALQESARHPLTGWHGHAAPFAFEPSYRPAAGITRAAVGTPMVLSLAALEVGIDIALKAPMAAIRAKSLRQSDLFAQLVDERCGATTFRRVTPRAAAERGSQICLAHQNAYEIMQALIARGVIGDFRAPDVLRFGFTPLYLRYQDVFAAVEALAAVMQNEEWRRPDYAVRRAVT